MNYFFPSTLWFLYGSLKPFCVNYHIILHLNRAYMSFNSLARFCFFFILFVHKYIWFAANHNILMHSRLIARISLSNTKDCENTSSCRITQEWLLWSQHNIVDYFLVINIPLTYCVIVEQYLTEKSYSHGVSWNEKVLGAGCAYTLRGSSHAFPLLWFSHFRSYA